MPELAVHLCALRARLVETMASALVGDGDWHAWLPLLAQVEIAIQAVEAVMGEHENGPVRTHGNGTSHAKLNGPKQPR